MLGALAALLITTGTGQAFTVIYSHDFSGGAAPLNGTAVDVGSGTWVAASTFSQNGTVSGTGAGTATLSFTPVDGLIYQLDARLTGTGTGANNDWLALGFADGQGTSTANSGANDNRFIQNQTVGRAWMLFRTSPDAPVQTNTALLGSGNSGTASNLNWINWTDVTGGEIEMRILLDTTGGPGTWTATWFAKRPNDTDYTMVRATTLLPDENITSVGFAKSNTAAVGTLHSFSLSIVPEPSAAMLTALGGLALLFRRRR